jgi:CTP-dependent riboflavin kinase
MKFIIYLLTILLLIQTDLNISIRKNKAIDEDQMEKQSKLLLDKWGESKRTPFEVKLFSINKRNITSG